MPEKRSPDKPGMAAIAPNTHGNTLRGIGARNRQRHPMFKTVSDLVQRGLPRREICKMTGMSNSFVDAVAIDLGISLPKGRTRSNSAKYAITPLVNECLRLMGPAGNRRQLKADLGGLLKKKTSDNAVILAFELFFEGWERKEIIGTIITKFRLRRPEAEARFEQFRKIVSEFAGELREKARKK